MLAWSKRQTTNPKISTSNFYAIIAVNSYDTSRILSPDSDAIVDQ